MNNRIKKYRFADLYEMASGLSSSKDQAGHGAPFVSFGTVFNNYFLPDELPDLMDTTEKEQEIYSIKENDVLITRTSETIDELAMSCVAIKDYPKATYSGFTKRLRPRIDDIVYSKYLAFYLRGYLFRKAVTNNAFMTLRASFNEDIFSFLNLYLPQFKQQVLIGDMLYKIEQKIINNKKINDNLMSQAELLYNQYFVNTTGIKHYLDSNYVSKNHIRLPAEWSLEKVSDAFDLCYGFPFNAELFTELPTNRPVVRIRDIQSGSTDTYTTECADSKYVLNPTDLIIGMDGNFHMNLWPSRGALLNQRCIRIRKSKYPVLLAYFSTKPFIKSREKNVSRTTVGHLSANDINELIILVPPKYIAENILPVFDSIAMNICKKNLENQSLIAYRDWLLPMLMNGQATIED